jgi:hypothetical protein
LWSAIRFVQENILKFKEPKTTGEASDRLYVVKNKRLAKEKEAKELKAQETALSNWLIDNLPASKADGVVGKLSKSVINTSTIPIVEDWDAFWKFVFKEKASEFLQRRLSTDAVKERWELGKSVPGVGKFDSKKVSVTKR